MIGLVCDEAGVPVAVEVWPGKTADLPGGQTGRSTVGQRVRTLKEQFGIEKAVFVGECGLWSETNIATLEALGLDYILRVDWHTQRQQLERVAPEQQDLFDRQGVAEWVEDGVPACSRQALRGLRLRVPAGAACLPARHGGQASGDAGMVKAQEHLEGLAQTAARGRYYSWVTLRQKVDAILGKAGVAGLWRIEIAYLSARQAGRGAAPASPEQKARLALRFAPDEDALARRMALEGTYVLRTSLGAEQCSPHQVDAYYRRVRASVLICFLAFYLVKEMELELRGLGESRLEVNGECRTEWQWTLGEVGQGVQNELQKVGWWNSVETYRRSLLRSLTS